MNEWKLIGTIGVDAELKQTQKCNVANTRLAVSKSVKKSSGEYERQTDWHNVVWYNANEKQVSCLKKGTIVLVEGHPEASAYLDKDGTPKASLKMIVNRLEVIKFPKNESNQKSVNGNYEDVPIEPTDDLPF